MDYYIHSSDRRILASASLAGFITWVILNRHSVRGDYASIFYIAAFGLIYGFACYFENIVHDPLIFSLTIAATYAFSALSFTVLYRLSPIHPLAKYPGPFWWRLTSLRLSYISYHGRRHHILDRLHKMYGPFVRIGPNVLSVDSPSGHLIYGAGHSMEKSDAYAVPGHLNAVALFFKPKSKEIHSNRKRMWATAFSGSSVTQFFSPLDRRTWQLINCIERRKGTDGNVDLSECVSHWAYDFMGEMVFGGCNSIEFMRDGDPEGMLDGLKTAATVLDSFGQAPWLMDIIWHLPVGKSMHKIRHRAAAMMRARVKAEKDVDMRDLSSHLLGGDPQTGEPLPQADLDLDAVVAVQGGSDNTAIILALAFYYLLSHSLDYERLRAELDHAFPDPTGHLDMAKLTGLTFLNAVLNETLRLGSPFFLPRVVPPSGATISGQFVPSGTIIALAAYSQQTSADNFYPDPLEFRPGRWCPEGLGQGTITEKSALASFSFGPHACVARNFAYQQLRFVVARLVLTVDMKLPPSFDVQAFRDGILNMRTTILDKPLMVQAALRSKIKLDTCL
ncbi:cytochrome P450 [Hysterangium stoloniferum]|nr:cytochrome P450 [Hysterangium stoloniferum]